MPTKGLWWLFLVVGGCAPETEVATAFTSHPYTYVCAHGKGEVPGPEEVPALVQHLVVSTGDEGLTTVDVDPGFIRFQLGEAVSIPCEGEHRSGSVTWWY